MYQYFLLFSLLIGTCWTADNSITCEDVRGPCSCMTNQGLVDLSPIEKGHPIPRFNLILATPPSGDKFSYTPCTAFTQENPEDRRSDCQNVLGCQLHDYGSNHEGLFWKFADQASVTWGNDPDEENALKLNYEVTGSDTYKRKGGVTLICEPDLAEDTLVALGETSDSYFAFHLRSRHACPMNGPATTQAPPGGGGGVGGLLCWQIFAIVAATVALCLLIYLSGAATYLMVWTCNRSSAASPPDIINDQKYYTKA